MSHSMANHTTLWQNTEASALPIRDKLRKGKIHPILARANFAGNIDYDAILPSIYIASESLESEDVLPYWETLMIGKCTKIQEDHVGTCYYLHDSQGRAADRFPETSLALLRQLSAVITFTTSAMSQEGTTRALTNRLDVAIPGYPSEIAISHRVLVAVYRNKLPLHQDYVPSAKEGIDMFPHLYLVQVLIHEIAHAARIAGQPKATLDGRHITRGCRNSEEGYEMEVKYFGGILSEQRREAFPVIRLLKGSPDDTILISGDWPDDRCEGAYIAARLLRSNVLIPYDRPEVDTASIVSYDFVRKIFTDTFWTHDFASLGIWALRPQRFGKFYLNTAHTRLQPHPDNPVDLDPLPAGLVRKSGPRPDQLMSYPFLDITNILGRIQNLILQISETPSTDGLLDAIQKRERISGVQSIFDEVYPESGRLYYSDQLQVDQAQQDLDDCSRETEIVIKRLEREAGAVARECTAAMWGAAILDAS